MECTNKPSTSFLTGLEEDLFSSTSPFTTETPEEIMDMIKVECECDSTESKPLTVDPLPSIEDYSGMYGFNMKLNHSMQTKSSSFYSRILKQVFIDMNKIMLVHFEMAKGVTGLFVRAMPVYSSPEHSSVPVTRCTVHSAESDPKGKAHAGGVCCCSQFDNVGHVIRAQSLDAQYCYDPRSARHSVIVPVKQFQPGSQSFAIAYYFACKTSCPKGMQRRPINVIFTLETAFGVVVGRKVVGVRICTCPKRDKERMEKDVYKAQSIPKNQSTRKRKYNTRAMTKSEGYLITEEMTGEISLLKKALLGFERKMNELSNYAETL